MRRFATVLCLIALAAAAHAAGIDWREGRAWKDVVAEAGAAKKPILIDFYATWCGPCKQMDSEVYTKQEVITELGGFVTYKVDVDKPASRSLTDQFKVTALPDVVVCKPDGTEIDRFLGFRPADRFLATVRDYAAGRNTLTDLEKRLAATPDDPQTLLQAGNKFAERGNVAKARPALKHLLELDPDNERGYGLQAVNGLAQMAAMERNYTETVDYLQRALHDYPAAVDSSETLDFLAWAQGRAGDIDGQIETFRAELARDGDDVATLNALAAALARQDEDLDDATDYALKAARLSDDAPSIADTVAEVYFRRGMYDDALTWSEKALAAQPDNPQFQQRKAKIVAARGGGN